MIELERHWNGRSRPADIEAGLRALVTEVKRLGVRTLAVPPLGCGSGGLDWQNVRPMIESALSELPDVHVLLFEPAGAPAPERMKVRTAARVESSPFGDRRPGFDEP